MFDAATILRMLGIEPEQFIAELERFRAIVKDVETRVANIEATQLLISQSVALLLERSERAEALQQALLDDRAELFALLKTLADPEARSALESASVRNGVFLDVIEGGAHEHSTAD